MVIDTTSTVEQPIDVPWCVELLYRMRPACSPANSRLKLTGSTRASEKVPLGAQMYYFDLGAVSASGLSNNNTREPIFLEEKYIHLHVHKQ